MTDERYGQPATAIRISRVGERPTGRDLFDKMTKAEQDELLGPDVAEAVRTGKVKLDDLVVEHQMETEDDFIAQATPQDLGIPPRDT